MGMYWLMDQHGHDGATALVETDGGMHIINVHRFGAGIADLDDQQRIWDATIGKLAPTLKPFVDASSVDEEGVEPHIDLQRGEPSGGRTGRQSAGQQGVGGGRSVAGGPSHKRSRGDR